MDRIEIYTSKKKSFLILLGSLAFVAMGIWLVVAADDLTGWRIRNPWLIRGLGVAAILFFGLGIFAGVKGMIKSEIALIIDPMGLNIVPKRSSTAFIKWHEILGFEEIKIQSTRIIIIDVKDPESWLEKETSTLRKKMMQLNINNYNSPFNIAASGLDISANELHEKLNSYFEKYNNKV